MPNPIVYSGAAPHPAFMGYPDETPLLVVPLGANVEHLAESAQCIAATIKTLAIGGSEIVASDTDLASAHFFAIQYLAEICNGMTAAVMEELRRRVRAPQIGSDGP